MFSKLLIANRGEIAVRIVRTCRRLGIKTVAIFSDADQDALHTKLADEAVRVGEAPPLQSYLSVSNICEAVRKSGAEAVHPGYGFLSEFHEFAQEVQKTGAIWVGPNPETMSRVESKTYGRRVARENGIPTIPGSYEPIQDSAEIEPLFKELGPLLIKPDAGGGGKGTRKLLNLDKAKDYFEAASRESKLYFGRKDVYAEKLLDGPRHVEVQILGDNFGNIIHVFERECSLQRRFQKIIEETPSPSLSPKERAKLVETGVVMARAVGYSNAGTFEFLYEESSGQFYFLEINKRLQVEHPVTEETTGIDLVEQQLKIADGQALSINQDNVIPRGHSIEARIYAEDPKKFIPSPGKITNLVLPQGPNVRVDHALEIGTNVSFYYDPLIAKLITSGNYRSEVISLMRKSLSEFVIEGIKTSIPFHKALFAKPDFINGEFDTTYLEAHLAEIQAEMG